MNTYEATTRKTLADRVDRVPRGRARPSHAALHSAGAHRPAAVPPAGRRRPRSSRAGRSTPSASGKEVGFYQDPYSDYGRLQDEMLRAIRLVVDTGLHHKKWTREQVVQFFRDHSAIDEVEIQSETDRYIVWPGQALALQDRAAEDPRAARARAAGARRQVRHPRLPRRGPRRRRAAAATCSRSGSTLGSRRSRGSRRRRRSEPNAYARRAGRATTKKSGSPGSPAGNHGSHSPDGHPFPGGPASPPLFYGRRNVARRCSRERLPHRHREERRDEAISMLR